MINNFKSSIEEKLNGIAYKISNFQEEFEDFKSKFENPELIEHLTAIDKKLNALIESSRDKILPTLIDVRLATSEEVKSVKETLPWLIGIWKSLKNKFKMEKPIVLVFVCDNCAKQYRFVFFEKTKLGKVINMVLKITFKFSDDLISYLAESSKNLSILVISSQKESEKLKAKGINIRSKILPDEAKLLYKILLGIENRNTKTLSETFSWKDIKGEVKFYCNLCD